MRIYLRDISRLEFKVSRKRIRLKIKLYNNEQETTEVSNSKADVKKKKCKENLILLAL